MKVDVKVGVGGKDPARGQRLFSTPPEDVLGGAKPLTIRFFDGATKPCWKTAERVSTTEFKTWGDETDYLYEGRKVFLKFKTTTPWSETGNYEVDDFVLHEDKTYICMQDHESSSETEPGNSAGYWSIAIFSVTVVSSIYDVDDDETTCEVEESQVFVELYSFKKWADIPEWCGALNHLSDNMFLIEYPASDSTFESNFHYYNNDFLVQPSVISNEYSEEGKTEEEIELIFDRKPLYVVEDRDSNERWIMKDGTYNFRVSLIRSFDEDPEHDVSPDLKEDDDVEGNWEIEEDEEDKSMIYKNDRFRDIFAVKFSEVGTRSYCHYFGADPEDETSNDILYAKDWFCPDGIFFAPFDTSDDTNFSVTTTPVYSADGESGNILSPFSEEVEIYLMPRRWAYYVRTRTGEMGECEPPSEELSTAYYNHHYVAIWWDRFPNTFVVRNLDSTDEKLNATAMHLNRVSAEYSGSRYRLPFGSGVYGFAGDYMLNKFGYRYAVAKFDGADASQEGDWFLFNQVDGTEIDISGDKDREETISEMESVGATQNEIDNVISGYNSLHVSSASMADVIVGKYISAPGYLNIGSRASGKTVHSDVDGYLGDSDDETKLLWDKIENSEFWNEYGVDSDIVLDHPYTRTSAIPFGIGISPHKAGSLLAIIKTSKETFFIWRKTNEEFNLYLYSDDGYDGNDFSFENELCEHGYFSYWVQKHPLNIDLWSQVKVEDNRKIISFGCPIESLDVRQFTVGEYTSYRTSIIPSEALYELEMPVYACLSRERQIEIFLDVEIIDSNTLKTPSRNAWPSWSYASYVFVLRSPRLLRIVDESPEEWLNNGSYVKDSLVRYRKKNYRCLESHESSINTNPTVNNEYWKLDNGEKLTIVSSSLESEFHQIEQGEELPIRWYEYWTECIVVESIPSGTVKIACEGACAELPQSLYGWELQLAGDFRICRAYEDWEWKPINNVHD